MEHLLLLFMEHLPLGTLHLQFHRLLLPVTSSHLQLLDIKQHPPTPFRPQSLPAFQLPTILHNHHLIQITNSLPRLLQFPLLTTPTPPLSPRLTTHPTNLPHILPPLQQGSLHHPTLTPEVLGHSRDTNTLVWGHRGRSEDRSDIKW